MAFFERLESVVKEEGLETIKIKCTGTDDIHWQDLSDLQFTEDGRSLKETNREKIEKLAESMLRFGLISPLQVWKDPGGATYCFDAHHRKKAFAILSNVGVEIPRLPTVEVVAATIDEARKYLIAKESRASWVNINVVPDYLDEVGLSVEIAQHTIDIPDFSFDVLVTDDDADEDFGLGDGEDDGFDDSIDEEPVRKRIVIRADTSVYEELLYKVKQIAKEYDDELIEVSK